VVLDYKGYKGRVKLDEESGLLHGEVLDLRDVVTFEGESVQELEKAFRDSVDDYLEFCAELDREPDRPFSGKFQLRISPELHRDVWIQAQREGKSLNQYVAEKLAR
jgi:predicted HicB family RNase H-like nuclease